MAGRIQRWDWIAAALVVAVFAAALTPLCTMPSCDDTGVASCSEYQPDCERCPETVVMKHAPDDAVQAAQPVLPAPVALALAELPAAPVVSLPLPSAPEPTASPPPLDPLGVQLTI